MCIESVHLTEYSHGAGCGCKISPKILDKILQSSFDVPSDYRLLVGNQSKDDAAAYDIGNGQVILSTTDFFMPIVDNPFDFGRIAATNAISDIYAMGGKPIMAIAILGWPIQKLSAETAQQVVDGGRQTCINAGITLAGGHSIDSPEPIFGLAVTGITEKKFLTQNNTANIGCKLYLTKPLGIGILTTAQKQKKLNPEHATLARDTMCALNSIGTEAAQISGVKAMTDITGFGLMGHLLEMCEGSNVNAIIYKDNVPILPFVNDYIAAGCIPGGTQRNFESYGDKLAPLTEVQRTIFCDPQTSGGLLIAVESTQTAEVEQLLRDNKLPHSVIGELIPAQKHHRIEIT